MSAKHGCAEFMGCWWFSISLTVDRQTPSLLVFTEGGYPTDIADRLHASVQLTLAFLLHVRSVKKIAAVDR